MSSKSKKAGNLVALGSAAVVAVYGAGFMRTAAAAERFAEQSDERVLSPEDSAAAQNESQSRLTAVIANDSNTNVAAARATIVPGGKVVAPRVNKADATVAKVNTKVQATAAASPSREVSVPVPPEVTTVISPNGAAVSSGVAPAVSAPVTAAPINNASAAVAKPVAEKLTAATTTATTTAQVPQAVSAPATVTAAPVVAPPSTPVSAPVAPTTTAPPSAPVAEAGVPKLKDGEYTGYGTSRHGDVEVYLETTDGKITYVKISQCLTQYSCSWISDLPKQVLTRQSPRVDGVSGATQSANAFYYAVVQALAKAK